MRLLARSVVVLAVVAGVVAGAVGAGCIQPDVVRPYPPPTAAELLARVEAQARAVKALRVDAKVDYMGAGGQRVKVGMTFLAELPDHLRVEAESPLSGTVASLATDGKQLQLLDVRDNRFLAGPASPCNLARLLQVQLSPAQVMTLLLGGVPILVGDVASVDAPSAVRAEVAWDPRDGGRERLTLTSPAGTQVIRFHGQRGRWDIVDSEVRGPDGAVRLRLRHADFSDDEGHLGVRLPGRSEIEEPTRHADARIRYRGHEVDPPRAPGVFQLTPPAGLPVETVTCSD